MMTINTGLRHALHFDPLADGLAMSLSAPFTTDIAVPGDWICPSSHSIVSGSAGTGLSLNFPVFSIGWFRLESTSSIA
jgi:hypothetical protein